MSDVWFSFVFCFQRYHEIDSVLLMRWFYVMFSKYSLIRVTDIPYVSDDIMRCCVCFFNLCVCFLT